MNRFNVRFDPPSFAFVDAPSFVPTLDDGIGEWLPLTVEEFGRSGECGRRHPFDQIGILVGNFEGPFPVFIGADFVPVNGEGA